MHVHVCLYVCGHVCMRRLQGLEMATAVKYLSESDTALQVLGAAYIQHQCYHSNNAKNQVRSILFTSVSVCINLFFIYSGISVLAAIPLCYTLCSPSIFSLCLSLSQVRTLHGIPALVELFSSENRAVQRNATGATRNLIYENAENKAALVDAGGVMRLVSILSEPDEELRKTIIGDDGFYIGLLDNFGIIFRFLFLL